MFLSFGQIYSFYYRTGWDSQNFSGKFVRFFVTLGLKILRLFKRTLKQISLKDDVNYCINHRVPIFYNYSVKAP